MGGWREGSQQIQQVTLKAEGLNATLCLGYLHPHQVGIKKFEKPLNGSVFLDTLADEL